MSDILHEMYKEYNVHLNYKGLNYLITHNKFDILRYIPPHCHDFYEMGFLTEGSFDHIVDGNTYAVSKPYFYLMSPLSFHGQKFTPKSSVFNIYFLAESISPILLDELLRINSFSHIYLTSEQYKNFKREILFLSAEYDKYEKNQSDFIIKNALERIIYLFLREVPKNIVHCNEPQLQNVLYFLHQNFRNSITLKDAADVANFSPQYFSTYFSQKMNTTFIEYLNSLRISYAASMLAIPDINVKTVAFECGFSSVSYFSRVFSKFYGKSPAAFQAQNNNERNIL